MTSSDVSIVLATHNGVRWLPDLLTSLGRQTLAPARLSILDDASTDGTWELVRDAAMPAGQTVVGRQESNVGAVRTFERLLSMVDTEYFALCDQDDVWLPDKLEKSLSLLESSGADLVYTDLRVVREDLSELAPSMWRLSNIVSVAGRALIPLILKNSITGCTVVGRTSMLKKALPFPPGIPMHDWWLGLVAACGNGVAPLPEVTVLYRQHGGSEVGAARFGYRGLRSRLDRGGTMLGTYLRDRLDARLALIDGLQERGLMSRQSFLTWFYRRTPLVRFLLNLVYLFYTATHARVLGFRNLVVDWFLTCLPLGSSRKGVTA
ncbi:glycosyltransferase family 2 protein [Candidatus Cryosericum odellii]|uniref:glycosyltransferase family 2 protein n=1 Tax=Candidatus Cryosericum odellii TaxID=2290917 RepID=UPI001A9ED50F|nr:glycosyltransferase family 2 protein [Candidatus Cryosericum odellii]